MYEIKKDNDFLDLFKINIAGQVNNEIHNKLNPYVPNIEIILKIKC